MWPKIWTQDDLEQIQPVARAGFEPGTARLRVWRTNHSATLRPCYYYIIIIIIIIIIVKTFCLGILIYLNFYFFKLW